ncbi:unnamed protein product [Brassica napus]|uniref:(rape) hypothetical protein n=1 Tax=Brassica napus TaxID=3708 RepID=A0A816TTV0_BRANA|nr:unnamed protein product [Brassica napus]
MIFSRWRVMDRRRIREGGERALCYREAEEESRVSEGFCGFNRSREIWLGDLRGCDNLLQGLDLVIFILRGGEATRDEEDRETFGTRSGFGLMVIFRSGLRFLGWKRGDRGGSGRKGPVLLITYSWMTRSFQTFTILFPTQGLIKDTSRSEQVLIAAFGRVVFTWMFWTLWEPNMVCLGVGTYVFCWFWDVARDRAERFGCTDSRPAAGLFKPVAESFFGEA